MEIELTVRDALPTDLVELSWTGGEAHLRAVVAELVRSDKVHLVLELPNGRLVGFGTVDFRAAPGAGTIQMLSIHPLLQSLGAGTQLIRALENRIQDHGRDRARIAVEHDNPRAAALYRRLGYVEVGDAVEHWEAAHGQTYVTVSTVLERALV